MLLDPAAMLGEGLHWDAEAQRLWMVDIHGQRLLRCNVSDATWHEWSVPQRIGWVIPEKHSEGLILGLQAGFARAQLKRETVSIEWLARPFEHRLPMRLNDAKADSTGSIWAGSLNQQDETRPDGCLFRLAAGEPLRLVDMDYAVANGPAIRADGRLMLHTDSGRRRIYAFDLDEKRGVVSNKRLWKEFAPEDGHPDGMTFDVEGFVWVAHWGAGCVSRFDNAGALMCRVRLPASNVTNVCFAGPALDRLLVSSARVGLTAEQLVSQPLAGALFEITRHGTTGLVASRAVVAV